MATIEHTSIVHAPPERVFALLERVEDLSEYSDLIQSIEPLGNQRYRWFVHAVGMDWTFDVAITECVPPERLAWESLSGVSNRGCYRLKRIPEGTEVTLSLEYQIKNKLLERAVNRAARPLVNKVSGQILSRVESRL
ncbi:SRPBCC family protein [Litchfieldella xinjiangensis]|uniref:SRPBCC family protein n=1 Tax=Litchfieldella xinjiangensis TaxID=1166948 RepID=UPI0005BB9565|nr:SRPBCC family protein [Halomonas xinjiangensis]